MEDLFMACANLLESGEDVVMISIIDHEGSAPRSAGSKMLVRRDHTIFGTIGGSIFEAQAIQAAQDVFHNSQAVTRAFSFSGNDLNKMDMVCGGKAKIFVDILKASADNAKLCRTVSDMKRQREEAYLITRMVTGAESENQVKLAVVRNGSPPEGMSLTAEEQKMLEPLCQGRYPVNIMLGETPCRIEPIHYQGTVYIFGAGHVSQKVAALTPALDFQTIILDDRAEYANGNRFPQADQIIVPEKMSDCVKDLPISGNSYIVIVTRGHAHDLTVLEQALQTDAGYIGMIGSKRKRETLYANLRRSGVTDEDLARVHCPIGMAIDAETPEEIAISIVGELIQARAKLING